MKMTMANMRVYSNLLKEQVDMIDLYTENMGKLCSCSDLDDEALIDACKDNLQICNILAMSTIELQSIIEGED